MKLTSGVQKRIRRSLALERLNKSLESGYKVSKDGRSKIELSDKDIKRIKNEIIILTEKIKI